MTTYTGASIGAEELGTIAKMMKIFSRRVPDGYAAGSWLAGYVAAKDEDVKVLETKARALDVAARAEEFGTFAIPDGWNVVYSGRRAVVNTPDNLSFVVSREHLDGLVKCLLFASDMSRGDL